MSADLYFTRDSFFLSTFFFCRRLICELVEPNSTQIGHTMVRSERNLKTHVRNLGYPGLHPTNRGPKNPLFGPTSQLTGKFSGLYLCNETWHRQSVKYVDNYKGSPTSSQNVMNFGWSTNGFKLDLHFYPP